jgi:hypothetical protein
MYHLEQTLVETFTYRLSNLDISPWGPVQHATEFFYRRGRTDVIALTEAGEIIAFEAKLKKWRTALHQAYRNTCFAHFSYIVVPEDVARRAIRYAAEFTRRSVGLCYPSLDGIVVLLEPPRLSPLQNLLSQQAAAVITERNELGSLL